MAARVTSLSSTANGSRVRHESDGQRVTSLTARAARVRPYAARATRPDRRFGRLSGLGCPLDGLGRSRLEGRLTRRLTQLRLFGPGDSSYLPSIFYLYLSKYLSIVYIFEQLSNIYLLPSKYE